MNHLILYRYYPRNRRRQIRERRRRVPQVPLDAFILSEHIFMSHYRFPKQIVRNIIELVREDLGRPTRRHNAVPVHVQVLVSLKVLASGSFQRVAGNNIHHGITQATVSKIFSKFLIALNRHARDHISFPRDAATLQEIRTEFYANFQFPGCIGCIDCTHIYISKPFREERWNAFINRKGRYSLNIQVICDAHMKILDIVAQYPGSVHDAYIYTNSGVREFLHSVEFPKNCWFLGDSGYPLQHCLLTPILRPQIRAEEEYNRRHRRTRNIIERTFGVLKSTWRILHETGGIMAYQPDKVVQIIISCAILHNILIESRIPLPFEEQDEIRNEDNFDIIDNPRAIQGEAVRRRLIMNYFHEGN